MTSRITEFNHPGYFIDEHSSGPFQHWRHEHYFSPDEEGGTVMRDVIDFGAPLGPLGQLAEWSVLNRYMPRLIRTRNVYLRAVAESPV